MRFYEYYYCDCKFTIIFRNKEQKTGKIVGLHLKFTEKYSKITKKYGLRLEFFLKAD